MAIVGSYESDARTRRRNADYDQETAILHELAEEGDRLARESARARAESGRIEAERRRREAAAAAEARQRASTKVSPPLVLPPIPQAPQSQRNSGLVSTSAPATAREVPGVNAVALLGVR